MSLGTCGFCGETRKSYCYCSEEFVGGGGATTTMVGCADLPADVAVIVAKPSATPTTLRVESTVATAVLLDVHDTVCPASTVAASTTDCPTSIVAVFGLTPTDAMVAGGDIGPDESAGPALQTARAGTSASQAKVWRADLASAASSPKLEQKRVMIVTCWTGRPIDTFAAKIA